MSEIILTEELEERVYKAYRLTLKSFRRESNGSTCRAAERRNRARKVVVERYNVSFQDIKRIIAKYDNINGVTHPDDPAYVLTRQFKVAEGEYLKNPAKSCPKCGGNDEVRMRPAPVEWQVYNEFYPTVLCDPCYTILEEDL